MCVGRTKDWTFCNGRNKLELHDVTSTRNGLRKYKAIFAFSSSLPACRKAQVLALGKASSTQAMKPRARPLFGGFGGIILTKPRLTEGSDRVS